MLSRHSKLYWSFIFRLISYFVLGLLTALGEALNEDGMDKWNDASTNGHLEAILTLPSKVDDVKNLLYCYWEASNADSFKRSPSNAEHNETTLCIDGRDETKGVQGLNPGDKHFIEESENVKLN